VRENTNNNNTSLLIGTISMELQALSEHANSHCLQTNFCFSNFQKSELQRAAHTHTFFLNQKLSSQTKNRFFSEKFQTK
jgi:hypothetical protein